MRPFPLFRGPRPSAAAALLVLAAGACTPQGHFTARVDGGALHESWGGPASAVWCRSRGVLLLSGGEGDRGISFVRFYGDSLRTDSVALGRPIEHAAAGSDSVRSAASGALRRTLEMTTIGYQTRYGYLAVTRPDSTEVGASFSAVFDRLGVAESLRVSGHFDPVPLSTDTSLCSVPRSTTDTGVTLSR